jgi:hypothetical protein
MHRVISLCLHISEILEIRVFSLHKVKYPENYSTVDTSILNI